MGRIVREGAARGPLIYRQTLWTRVCHWSWAVCLFFLLLSGFQIFNAHPKLYLGAESGFEYDNSIFEIGAREAADGARGFVRLGGAEIETTGYLGLSAAGPQAFPPALTIPSYYSLATGRIVHFLFAWALVVTLAIWLAASIWNGHLARDLVIGRRDLAALPRDIADHARLRFHHGRSYNVLQKCAYAGVLFAALPLMIVTGLCMSPGFNAVAPWLPDLFGGRQTARTLHFAVMVALLAFFLVHMLMILAAGPLNELRSILTGWYRIDPEQEGESK
ncbi:MAG TPA: cytochrome b/b6 domain-containing protein [Paracoccaceae bacterium]|nr:cytochrome b/b6 domain-containing protein [Paracoccaceae bacterium]